MSRFKLILIMLLVVVLGGLSGAVYYASTLVSPDEVRRLALEKLEQTFPQSQIDLGELNFSMGPTFKFDLERLAVSSPGKNTENLFSVEDVQIKVPVWAILFGGGDIDIRIQSPEVRYVEMDESNNWVVAMKKKGSSESTVKKDEAVKKSGQSMLVIPGFLANSRLNLRVSNLKLHYQLEKQKGTFEISKFLVRNLNVETSTAFELDSKLSFEMGQNQKINFDTLVIGQLNLANYLNEGQLPVMAVIKINNLAHPMLSRPLSEIKTDINLLIKDEDVTGKLEVRLLNDVRLNANLLSSQEKTGLSELDVNIPLQDIFSIIDIGPQGMDFKKATLSATGEINVQKDGKILPNLSAEMGPRLVQNLMGESLEHKLEASLVGDVFDSKLTTDLFSGTMVAKMQARLNLNEEVSLESLPLVSSSVNISNLSIPESYIQKMLYSKKDKNESKDQQAPAKKETSEQKETPVILPPGKLSLNLSNILLGEEVLSGEGLFEMGRDFVATKKFNFEYSKGKGNLTHLSKLSSKVINHQFDFSFKGFDLNGAKAFLPPQVGKLEGAFNLELKGSAQTMATGNKGPRYDFVISTKGKDGEAQVLVALEEKLNDLLSNIPKLTEKLKSKGPLDVDGSFDSLSFQSKVTEKKYDINKLTFVGSGQRFTLEGAGDVYPPQTEKNSKLDFVYRENKGNLVKHLKDLTGGNSLEVRLAGRGYSLKPDYGHTIERLAKSALKNKGKKVIKKEVKKLESKVKDELEKKGKEKLKNLLGL